MAEFIEERLLESVAFGTSSGAEFKTLIASLKTGVENRQSQWKRSLGRFSIIYKYLLPEHHALVVDAFMVCKGRFVGFRFRDPLDYTALNEQIGVGTGAQETYQLVMNYDFGIRKEVREVYKPVPNVVIYVDGVQVVPDNVDYTTGLVTLTAPVDSVITWSGEFDKPVRFDSDNLQWTLDDKAGGVIRLASTDIELVELRTL